MSENKENKQANQEGKDKAGKQKNAKDLLEEELVTYHLVDLANRVRKISN
jgi:hypothetical protein